MKGKILLNVDSRPSFTRLTKGTIVEVIKDMPNNYVLVEWNKMYLPIPKSAVKVE